MTTITEETLAKMSDVDIAKLQIEMLTNLALCEYYNRKVATLTFKEVSYCLDIQPQKTLFAARDTLVDAYEEQSIPEIIAKCVSDHNAKIDAAHAEKQRIAAEKQAKLDALTETEIAHLFDACLTEQTYKDIEFSYHELSTLSCSLEVFATISDNCSAISYFKYYLIDDAPITYDLVCNFIEATHSEDAFSDIEDMLSYLRSDFSDAIANKDWEALEDIKERISRISF